MNARDAQLVVNVIASLYKLVKRITGGQIGGVVLPSQRDQIGQGGTLNAPHRPGGVIR